MISKFPSFIFNSIKSLISSIMKFPAFIKKQILQLVLDFKNLRYKLKDMTRSNMELGIYHLRMRNFKDAVFRFKMIDKFLDPNNKEANYWLGWSYFFLHDYKKSIIALTKAEEEDNANLLSFIKSIDSINEIPMQIYEFHRDISSPLFEEKFLSEDKNIPKKLIFELKQAIDTMPEEYDVLELGSNVGLLGYEIKKRMPVKSHVTSVEISQIMLELQKTYFPKKKFYDNNICESIDDFLTKDKKKYNIILSLEGLSFVVDLKNIFSKVSSKLETDGYFAFLIASSDNSIFSEEKLIFIYDAKEIEGQLIEAGFDVLSSSNISLEIKNNYTIFVCRKTQN